MKAVEQGDVTYYLRSTVLGGQVIEELDSVGAKQTGFVYAGKKLIGHQLGTGNVSLLYEEPSGVSVRHSSGSSSFISYWLELDPWGAEVYKWDPYVGDPGFSGGRGEGGPMFPGVGDISMPSTGCSLLLDGVLTLCDFASGNLNGDSLLVERMLRNGTREYLPVTVVLGVPRVMNLRLPRAVPRGWAELYDGLPDGPERLLQHFGVLEVIDLDLGQKNPVTENDPHVLQGANNGKDCGVVVNFKPGTTNPTIGLPNGPSTITYNGAPNFGLGFSVSGWVGEGGIGTIGVDEKTGKKIPNPQNPTGRWSLEQWTHSWIGENGNTIIEKKTFPDVSPHVAGMTTYGNTFGYYDHPGGPPPSEGFSRFDNYVIKVYSGKTVCEVKFHMVQSGKTIHWGPGLR